MALEQNAKRHKNMKSTKVKKLVVNIKHKIIYIIW